MRRRKTSGIATRSAAAAAGVAAVAAAYYYYYYGRASTRSGGHAGARSAIVVDRPPDELSRRWQEFQKPGMVAFQPAPGGRGTLVVGDASGEDLRRFKQLVEAGEIATTEGQPSARARASRSWREAS